MTATSAHRSRELTFSLQQYTWFVSCREVYLVVRNVATSDRIVHPHILSCEIKCCLEQELVSRDDLTEVSIRFNECLIVSPALLHLNQLLYHFTSTLFSR